MITFVLKNLNKTYASFISCNIGKSQHQRKVTIFVLLKSYLVTFISYVRFSKEKFAYLFQLLKKKGNDNASN